MQNYIEQIMYIKTANDLAIGHRDRMKTWLYHQSTPPTYIYHRATSAYTAVVQLYARSGQLPTANITKRRNPEASNDDDTCRLGCNATEDPHHIFVECEVFEAWRREAGSQLHDAISVRMVKRGISEETLANTLEKAKCFFEDRKDIWPLGNSQFYLGHVPKIEEMLPAMIDENKILREKTIHGIYCDWHNASVRLASRIYGEFQRRIMRRWEEKGKN